MLQIILSHSCRLLTVEFGQSMKTHHLAAVAQTHILSLSFCRCTSFDSVFATLLYGHMEQVDSLCWFAHSAISPAAGDVDDEGS